MEEQLKKTRLAESSIDFLRDACDLLGERDNYLEMIKKCDEIKEVLKRDKGQLSVKNLCDKYNISKARGYALIAKYLIKEKI